MACNHKNYYGTSVGFVCRDCGAILPERPTGIADPELVKAEEPAAEIEKKEPAKKAPAKKTTGRAKK